MTRHSLLAGVVTGCLLVALPAAADPPALRMTAPVLGYYFDDSAKTIRAISGVPGAASVAGTVETPVTLQSAVVHSGARVAVGSTKEKQLVAVAFSGPARVTPIATELAELTGIAFSRAGNYVALTDGQHVEVWSSLEASPVRTGRFHPDAGITQVAVSSQGEAAVATPTGLVLRFLGDEAHAVATGGEWSALEFAADGADLFAAEASRKELVRISGNGGQSVLGTLQQAATSLAVSGDGTRVAAVAGQSVVVAESSGLLHWLACECSDAKLDGLSGELIARLRGTALALDADSEQPRLFTLPNLTVSVAGGSAE